MRCRAGKRYACQAQKSEYVGGLGGISCAIVHTGQKMAMKINHFFDLASAFAKAP